MSTIIPSTLDEVISKDRSKKKSLKLALKRKRSNGRGKKRDDVKAISNGRPHNISNGGGSNGNSTFPNIKITIPSTGSSPKVPSAPAAKFKSQKLKLIKSLEDPIPNIKISKTVTPTKSPKIFSGSVRGRGGSGSGSVRGGGGRRSYGIGSGNVGLDTLIGRGGNDSSPSYHERGSGPSLFERNTSSTRLRNPQETGSALNLFSGSRLNISNLHPGIVEGDLLLIFRKVGEVKSCKINYDRSGRSNGTGYVIYEKHRDAMEAQRLYQDANLDGKPLSITFGSSLQQDINRL
ncbi:RNA-binding region RNP-1 domain-containing protein [Tieghemostelium lacteum]|uniref:RNA-binding region RNP-1 domain-containing protein n=1 Tax=Tieghemostelium lacteum TaxID=361077 RepID=A0A151ZJR4_TIELA|nr:RNA-binding region RNP-1 domain-containing protein [Tieghemostelium lacteum]|eukprot:KYQ94241.1 RNA-binding region RNP-1 domain-containing protein [Tieghemostelium lacteum]